MPVDRDAVRAWLEASCAAQGVPVLVSDPGVISQVGVLVRGAPMGAGSREGAEPMGARSQAPGGDDSGGVEYSRA